VFQVEQGIGFRPSCFNPLWPIAAAAKQGLGNCLIASEICEADVESGLLVPVLSDWLCNTPEFNALIPSKKLLTPKVKAFIEFLKTNPWSQPRDF
jgi:DNA-binding transcriptional LysR family regulator